MRKITKSAPPASFVTYCQQAGARYDSIDPAVKHDLLISLLNEQGWICGYCQQRISNEKRAKIEHHCEQTICDGKVSAPDRRLDYTNLMAVCLGQEGPGTLTCDSSKATFDSKRGLPINVSPWTTAHMSAIKYASSGLIDSKVKQHSDEINNILNLNSKRLRDLRKLKYQQIWRIGTYSDGSIHKDKMRRILEKDIENPERFASDFPGLSEYMLAVYC